MRLCRGRASYYAMTRVDDLMTVLNRAYPLSQLRELN
jgi:hypothetical protein